MAVTMEPALDEGVVRWLWYITDDSLERPERQIPMWDEMFPRVQLTAALSRCTLLAAKLVGMTGFEPAIPDPMSQLRRHLPFSRGFPRPFSFGTAVGAR